MVSLNDGLDTESEIFDLAELLCINRGAEAERSRYGQQFHLPDKMQEFNNRLKCGQLSLPRMIKPMIGPGLQELQSKITNDRYWIFSMVKDLGINFVFGALNFCVDLGKSILTSRWKDVKPDDETTIIQMLLSGTFILILLRYALRLLIFLSPMGNLI